MGDKQRIELDDRGLRRLVTAVIGDAFRVVATENYSDHSYYEANHAANWLTTEGAAWAEAVNFGVSRPIFRATVNGHLARHELAAALRDLNKPAKKPMSYQLKLPISE